MKWTRETPGRYVAGPYRVEQVVGSTWRATGPGMDPDVNWHTKVLAQDECRRAAERRLAGDGKNTATPVVGDWAYIGEYCRITDGKGNPLYVLLTPRKKRRCLSPVRVPAGDPVIACRRWRCPACGTFGRRARRRAERAADALHIAWARHLAAGARRSRADSTGLIAVTDCRVLGPGTPPGRYERTVRLPAVTLHTHGPEVPCRGAETGCSEYPATTTTEVTDILPELTEEQREGVRRFGSMLEQSRNAARQYLAERQHAELDEYDTADVTAEVVGELTYEEQSEMIGDPIADVIKRETE